MKVLVIKFSSIGDIILSTSPLSSLRQKYPNSHIHFLTLETYAPLLEGHPDINRLFVLNKSAGYREIKRIGKYFSTQNYDLVIDLHNTLRAKVIRRQFSETQVRVLKKPRWKRFKLFYFHRNDFDQQFSQIRLLHEPIKYLLDQHTEFPLPTLYVSKAEKEQLGEFLTTEGIKQRYVVLIPGAAWPQKQWIAENYSKLIKKLVKSNIDVVILGGGQDRVCEELSNSNPEVLDLHGKTDLRESLAIVAQAGCVIGSDTGLLYGAEALNIPVVMMAGPTSRETGAGSLLKESVTLENNDLWCRPCSQNGSRKCYRKEQYCMTGITVESVWDEIKRRMGL